MQLKKLVLTLSLVSMISMTGCSAVGTAVKKRNLEVQIKMSQTIWLEPADTKTVYLQIKNTSDKNIEVESKIISALQSKGYSITQDSKNAQYWIQANVLKVDKMDLRDAEALLNRGYEGAALGAVAAGSVAAYNGNSTGSIIGVGIVGGLVGAAADAMVEDTNFTMITDIQIGEKVAETVTTQNNQALTQGTSGAKVQTSTATGNRAKYQTRIVSNANQVNLKFEKALPELENQLAKSIAGIL